jgi:hypothetical protein
MIGGIDYLLSNLILAPGQRAGFATKAPRHQGSLFLFLLFLVTPCLGG